MGKNRRETGSLYERKAADYLEKCGLKILEQNFRSRTGEIDLIALDGTYLVFVEVKYRSTDFSGDSLCAVDFGKQRVISRTAQYYMKVHRWSFDTPCRFDVVGIDGKKIHWIKNAFDFCG